MATALMGILNITSDSFSDGGQYLHPASAILHATDMVAAGATIIDIGSESTRPGASALSAETEWARLAPVLEALCPALTPLGIQISIDTRHAATAQKAAALGVHWINDVSGGDSPEMLRTIAEHKQLRYVIMHHLGIPADATRTLPPDADCIAVIRDWAEARLDLLESYGIVRERVILDPGIGFGKTAQQSLAIIQKIGYLRDLGCPLLVGHSRKSFLQLGSNNPAPMRDLETHIVSIFLSKHSVNYLRVHDIVGTKRALAMAALLPELVEE
jgi:dihydropteroate synthase